jgi:hypothetical protein
MHLCAHLSMCMRVYMCGGVSFFYFVFACTPRTADTPPTLDIYRPFVVPSAMVLMCC